jgi:hypothetical protein
MFLNQEHLSPRGVHTGAGASIAPRPARIDRAGVPAGEFENFADSTGPFSEV